MRKSMVSVNVGAIRISKQRLGGRFPIKNQAQIDPGRFRIALPNPTNVFRPDTKNQAGRQLAQ